MKKFFLLIAFFSLIACSSDDDLNSDSESDFYTVTLKLQGISGAGYNTDFRINTFHQSNANLLGVYEFEGDIHWENGSIEHTFTVDAVDIAEKPLTRIVCFVHTTLHQEYSYAIDYFTFTAKIGRAHV